MVRGGRGWLELPAKPSDRRSQCGWRPCPCLAHCLWGLGLSFVKTSPACSWACLRSSDSTELKDDNMDLKERGEDFDVLPETDKEGVEIEITDDAGVKKKILTAGQGYENPQSNDEVFGTYWFFSLFHYYYCVYTLCGKNVIESEG